EKHLELLRNDFARLEPLGPDLAEAALRFVVDGEGPEVLGRLSGTPGCGRALGLAGCVDWQNLGGDRKARDEFFHNPPAADPRFFLRLAQLYAAAARPNRNPNYSVFGLPDWIELFLWEATNSSPASYYFNKKSSFHADVLEKVIEAGGESPELLTRTAVLV